jgi:hypothetical protein
MDQFSKIRNSNNYPKDTVTGLIASKDLTTYSKWGDLKEQQQVFV